MGPSGFTNSFTSGEVDDNAWDRPELQPVAKACELAQNLVVRVAGPLGKRRGFWLNGPISDQAHKAKLVPFRKDLASVDCFVLEMGNLICHLWQTNGAPFIDVGTGQQLHFATPYTDAQVASGLRWKQVGDVIYFRHATGITPQILARANGGLHSADWTFTAMNAASLINGPWQSENIDLTSTVTLQNTGGPADMIDRNGGWLTSGSVTGAGAIPAGATVTIAASKAIFNANMVGQQLRVRANGNSVSCLAWTPGTAYFGPSTSPTTPVTTVGDFATSVGQMYYCSKPPPTQDGTLASNPPVQDQGTQSDGANVWTYLHDGAGVITLTGFTDSQHMTGTVIRTCPLQSTVATSYFAFSAYGGASGWPSAWPELREERLAEGATPGNLDFVDLTQTAGFSPTQEDFTPGTGLDTIVSTNAIRARVGIDGAQIRWFDTATYLVAGTDSAIHLIAGSVLDEPLSPGGRTIKQLTQFGTADVQPAKVFKGLCYVTTSGQQLREVIVGTQQEAATRDLSYLAQHIATQGIAQLAWTKEPDHGLWLRLGSGAFACFTYHQEQQVEGFTRQLAGGGMTIIDTITMPGPGNLETLWALATQTIGGVTSTFILMMSQVSDGLFMDAASLYQGAPANIIANIPAALNGQAVDVLADRGWYQGLVVEAGSVQLPNGDTTTKAQVGFTYPVKFKSLKLDLRIFLGSLLQKERVTGCIIDVKCAQCTVSGDGVEGEDIEARHAADEPGAVSRRLIREVTVNVTNDHETESRDPRLVITEQTPYDFVLYSLKPDKVSLGTD